MPVLVAEPQTDFQPAPAGLHRAVCVDVVDLGMQETQWGEKHKVRVVWQIEEAMENGRLFSVGQRYTASLHQKSKLRQDLESWRGRPFTAEELRGFDLEKLIGANAQLNVVHNTNDGRTFANVATIVPAAKGAPKLEADGSYTRVKDRPDYVPADQTSGNGSGPADDDDSMPF